MNEQEIRGQLKEIFRQVAPEVSFERLDTSRPLRDQTEMDSFDFYRILVQINERLGVNIPDSQVSEMRNLDQLIGLISVKTSGPSDPHLSV